jgi:outer membrane protein, heavy metal efflux system
MPPRQVMVLSFALLASGCLWPVREKTDEAVAERVAQAVDMQPASIMPPAVGQIGKPDAAPLRLVSVSDVQTTALMQAEPKPNVDLEIPARIPGSETPILDLKGLSEEEAKRKVRALYPELPPIPEPPTARPGPGGKPYTLADLQRLAAENSPTLRQAAADVQTARGNLIQAGAYPNPSVGWEQDPSSNGSTSAAFGMYVDQVIKTFGKLKLASTAAERDLVNAEVALKRAKSDLATSVRSAYYGLLVADETMRVTLDLARFTDEIYRLQAFLTKSVFFASYEPAALRAQSFTIRLAYEQAVANYISAWQQLVAALGLPQLPLSEVTGSLDRFIPRYDYDTALAHILRNHTDVITAQHTVEKARHNLKLAQITPYPDIEVRFTVQKDVAVSPQNWYTALQVGGPIPLWDRNKGNIIAAQGTLERAIEQPHAVAVNLTGSLAVAYANYKTNLDALVYYRRSVLPDQVRYYRGVYRRRHLDPNAAFGDLVQAQQTLTANVTTYLSTLGSFWSAVVQMANLLQTDDLFQISKAEKLPDLPDLRHLSRWTCEHGTLSSATPDGSGDCGSTGSQPTPTAQQLPAPRRLGVADAQSHIPVEVKPIPEGPGR